jgi:hypothetical protein
MASGAHRPRIGRQHDQIGVLAHLHTEAKELFNGFWILDVSS